MQVNRDLFVYADIYQYIKSLLFIQNCYICATIKLKSCLFEGIIINIKYLPNFVTVFLFGILSSPLPYLLMAVFYFFGFATGMFKGNAEIEPDEQIQVKNIQVQPQIKTFEIAEFTFQFHDYKFQKKIDNYAFQFVQPQVFSQKEKLNYFVHDIKVHHSPSSGSNFCRPPPSRS